MSFNATMQQAKALYDQGKFQEASKLANSLVDEENAPLGEIFLLDAKCLIRVAPSYSNANEAVITKSLIAAVKDAKTAEEGYAMLNDFHAACLDWQREQLIDTLAWLTANPTIDNYKAYLQVNVKCLMLHMTMDMQARMCDHFKGLLAEEGLTPKEATEKYSKKPDNWISEDETKTLEYDTACAIFNQVKAKVEARTPNMHEPLLNALMTAELLAKNTAGEKLLVGNEVKLERLQRTAEMIRFRLTSTVVAGGKEYHMYNNSDGSGTNDLNKVYVQIKQLDPSFVPPQLPKPAAKSGCYVATAVYGSYDCPQVWTLRRYRDNTLAKTWYGRAFIRTYYAVSPTLVKWFGKTNWFKKMWKGKLDRMVRNLQAEGVESTPYEDRNW